MSFLSHDISNLIFPRQYYADFAIIIYSRICYVTHSSHIILYRLIKSGYKRKFRVSLYFYVVFMWQQLHRFINCKPFSISDNTICSNMFNYVQFKGQMLNSNLFGLFCVKTNHKILFFSRCKRSANLDMIDRTWRLITWILMSSKDMVVSYRQLMWH